MHARRVFNKLLQRHHGHQRNGELCYHQYGSNCTELVVHGHVVQEEVGKSHEVLAPRQCYGEHGGKQQSPANGSTHYEQRQDKEHAHKGAHIDGTAGARLFAPILPQLAVQRAVLAVGLGHGALALRQGHACTALGVGDKQSPGLAYAIAPCSDIAAFQTARCLVGRILGLVCQLTLASHTLLAVFPSVIQVGQVDGHTQEATNGKGKTALEPALHSLTTQIREQPAYGQGKNGQEEVVGHLHMVGNYLQCHEQSAHHYAPTALASVAKRHTSNGGGNEGQGVEFPDVTCCNDYEIVAGECP